MASFKASIVRAVALELKEKVLELNFQIQGMYQETLSWLLNGTDPGLPLPYDVKIQLDVYEEIQFQELQLTEWVEALRQAQFGDTLTYGPVPVEYQTIPCPVWIPTSTGITFPSDNPISL